MLTNILLKLITPLESDVEVDGTVGGGAAVRLAAKLCFAGSIPTPNKYSRISNVCKHYNVIFVVIVNITSILCFI